MTFSCEKNVLLEAVSSVIRVIPSKSSSPVLEGILIVVKDGCLYMTGSDTELSIQTVIEVMTNDSLSFIVNAKLFAEMLGKLDNGLVKFDLEENGLMHMHCGVIQYDIPTRDAELYPTIPMVEKKKSLTLQKNVLHSMLRQTLFSVATTDTRPILRGALFDITEGKLNIVTTDTCRLSVRSEPYENKSGEDFSFIVPAKALNEIVRTMKADEGVIKIGLASTHAVLEFDNVTVTTRLFSGEFLKYKTLIPTVFKTKVVIKSEEFRKTIDRASVLISEKSRTAVRVSFNFDTVIISCRTHDGNNFYDELHAKIEGDNIEIGFNDKYLSEALAAAESEEVVIELNSPVSSVLITPKDKSNAAFIVSPMRLS